MAMAFSSQALGAELGYPSETVSEAIETLQTFEFSDGSAGGGVAVVSEDGWVVFQGLGVLRDRSDAIATFSFRAGSVSKLITALLAARLVDSSVVDWNDVMDGPERGWFENRWPESPVTLAQLFEHTAGLEGSDYVDFGQWPADITAGEYISSRKPFVLRWEPGKHYSYANSGAVLAAGYIEAVTGIDFDQLVAEEVFAPLDMGASTFLPEMDLEPWSRPVAEEEQGIRWFPGVRAAGSLESTLQDLSQVVLMFLRDGAGSDGSVFLEESTIERIQRSESSLAANHGAGDAAYGIGLFPFVIDGRVFRGHWGRIDGFQTTLGYCRNTGRGFVVWTDLATRGEMGQLRSKVAAVIKDPDPVSNGTGNLQEGRDWECFSGIYRNFTHDMKVRTGLFGLLSAIRIESVGELIQISGVWPWSPSMSVWEPDEKGVFRLQDFPLASGVLVEEGNASYWIDGESWRRTNALTFWVEGVALFGGILMLVIGSTLLPAYVAGSAVIAIFRRTALFWESVRFWGWIWITLGSWVGLLFLLSFVSWGIFGGTGDIAELSRPGPEALLLAACSVVGPLLSIGLLLAWRRLGGFQRILAISQLVFWIELVVLGLVPLISWV